MTGEKDFPKSKGILIPKEIFLHWIDALQNKWSVIGPVKLGGKAFFHERGAATHFKAGVTALAVFREISSYRELFLDYQSTMLPPGKTFLLRPDEELLKFTIGDGMSVREVLPERKNRIIFGIHPCDVNAILYLDRTFLGAFIDPIYQALRQDTMLIALNCTSIDRTCFCSSVGAGPYLKAESGYDMLLTDFGSDYLVEIKSKRAKEMFVLRGQTAGPGHEEEKAEKEAMLLKSFIKKSVTIQSGILMENLAHPIWKQTADSRCLSCGNCIMVCPTCFCHDIVDRVEMNLKDATRYRRWDACQDLRFAEVHGGNFRGKRTARLRQFVMHKLDYEEQYGRVGTVGCGRCIRWCPTSIDLTEISKTIMEGQVEGGEKPVSSV